MATIVETQELPNIIDRQLELAAQQNSPEPVQKVESGKINISVANVILIIVAIVLIYYAYSSFVKNKSTESKKPTNDAKDSNYTEELISNILEIQEDCLQKQKQ